MRKKWRIVLAASVALIVGLTLVGANLYGPPPAPPSFASQICSLPSAWVTRIKRGYFAGRSGDITLLPSKPAYMASGAGGWTHSGPWNYLQHVPLVFYGPGIIPALGAVERPVTMADVAPTYARLLGAPTGPYDGRSLKEMIGKHPSAVRPRLLLSVVWDGGGWDALNRWPDAWPNLKRMMARGTSFVNATDGSSPSVTPAIHTTLGTGDYPSTHGITDISIRTKSGDVSDAFFDGESSRLLRVPTFAERWDQGEGNRALVGMVGYEPWHLGMIGRGAERKGGDKDDAAWLDRQTNAWISNSSHYRLPVALSQTPGLQADLRRLDARDGTVDDTWDGERILGAQDRIEETPAFIQYQARALLNMVHQEGYGRDRVTDLLFTNFKQVDRDAHYWSMESPQVHDAVRYSDRVLDTLIGGLNKEVGRGRWAMLVTADHGIQPDAPFVNGYGIDPRQLRTDIEAKFGPVVDGVWSTQVFLNDEETKAQGVTAGDVARFISAYRLMDNRPRLLGAIEEVGTISPRDRLFAMSIPSGLILNTDC